MDTQLEQILSRLNKLEAELATYKKENAELKLQISKFKTNKPKVKKIKLKQAKAEGRRTRKAKRKANKKIKIAQAKPKQPKVWSISEKNHLYLGLKAVGITDEMLADLGIASDADLMQLYNRLNRDPHNELFYAGGDTQGELRRLLLPEERQSDTELIIDIIKQAMEE